MADQAGGFAMNTGPSPRPTISDLLAVTLITLVGYFAAFVYYREYAVALGIPPDLISINPSSLLVAAYDIWIFILYLGLAIGVVYLTYRQLRTPLAAKLRIVALLLLPFAIPWILYENRTIRITGIFAATLLLYSEFLRPLWKHREVKGYFQKLKADADDEKRIFDKVAAQFTVPVRLFLLAFAVVLSSSAAGRIKALHTHRFLVLDDRPDFIVPALSLDQLVAVRIDRKVKKILPEVVIITREPGKPLVLRWEEIGNLTPVRDVAFPDLP
jgi:hypothetical protein